MTQKENQMFSYGVVVGAWTVGLFFLFVWASL